MEPIKERFCMVSDKELFLQTLNLNNVPSVELVDPKTCSYPIIGRMFGHYGGKDISIIHTKEQAMDEDFDFYTKLYVIEKEYKLEVEALDVKSAQLAVARKLVFNEVPIRTEPFGWDWKDIDRASIPEEWHRIAVRALYVTGLKNGFVKIGMLPNESVIVIDINRSESAFEESVSTPALPFTMGADVEFMLSCDDEFLPASTFFPVEGPAGCDERQIEKDSGEYALVELRPVKADTPYELFNHVKKLIEDASIKVPYENIQFRGGSMPFKGYQCGGHIHFGLPYSLSLLRALDHYLALPIAMIEEPKTARLRRRTKHGGLGRYRVKPYGFEYLSLSSWIIDPKLTMAILCLSRVVAAHHHELESDFLFNTLVQRAYYQGNQIFLKQFWPVIRKRIVETSSFPQYKDEIFFLFKAIEKGPLFSEASDIRQNWGLKPPKQVFDTGHIIQIPKGLREKYSLKEGEIAKVTAGKRISTAEIRPYPFSFRQSNTVHLSKRLREKLSLPKDWKPKLLSVNGVLCLGPIVGILAKRPFGRQSTYFKHLCRLAQEKQMLVYEFEPQDIIWDQMKIKGTSLEGEGLFPFPAVIYDRYFFTGANNVVDIDEVRDKLQIVHHIPFVNPQALFAVTGDKWRCHQLLVQEYEEYLPESRLLKNLADITEMLDNYGEIFIKPLYGGGGLGVIRVIRRPTGIHVFSSNQPIMKQVKSIEEFYLSLQPLLEKGPYLVQEGIRRKQYEDKNLEIRVYMQKSEKQIWLRTGMVGRMTSEDVMTEDSEKNMRLSHVFNKLYPVPSERRQVYNQLAKISRSVVETIEEEVGSFGEIAVDLCIDQYDSIKLLEINAKPDNLFSQIGAYKLRNLAGIRLLNYATTLTGFKSDDNN